MQSTKSEPNRINMNRKSILSYVLKKNIQEFHFLKSKVYLGYPTYIALYDHDYSTTYIIKILDAVDEKQHLMNPTSNKALWELRAEGECPNIKSCLLMDRVSSIHDSDKMVVAYKKSVSMIYDTS